MTQSDADGLRAYLESGRGLLQSASETYGRRLLPDEYWWLGVGLAATTLAELSGLSFVVGRIDQLIDRAGHKGVRGDWLQRFVEELANMDAEGLLWPLYERDSAGQMAPTGAEVQAEFDAEAAWFVALGHIAIAAAVQNEETGEVDSLAVAIAGIITEGLTSEREQRILQGLQALEADGA